MRRYLVSVFLMVSLISAFCAYTIIDSLIREFSKDVTYIDLGSISVLGLISGMALGVAFAFRRKQSGVFKTGDQMTYKKLLELHSQPGSENFSIDWIDVSTIEILNAKGKK